MTETGIGASARRKEDLRFLTGRGTYTDDISRPGQGHAHIVRSPYAHARVKKIDKSAAETSPGVIAMLTGADMADDNVGGVPCGFAPAGAEDMVEPRRPALAVDTVRYVGDLVAVVVAESLEAAKTAAEKLKIDYEILPAAASLADADKSGAPQVHAEAKTNTCFNWALGDQEATDRTFADAYHVTALDIVNSRLIPNAMEPRAAIGDYDAGQRSYCLHTTTQNPHVIRLLMGAFVLGIPEHKLRVVGPDVGGGFGSKIPHYPEEVIVAWAAKRTGRPVKWTADRTESFLSDTHGRDHITHAELALDKDGKILGLRVATTANLGAYLSTFGPLIPTFLYATLLSGQYAIPAIHCTVKALFTHTAPLDALRGAGRPEATYVIERLVDEAARETGIDPVELRRRNFIPPDAFPYQTPVALLYDSGDYGAVLDAALKQSDHAGFEKRRQDASSRGKLRGIGLSTYIEACGIAPSNVAGAIGARAGLYESAEVRLHPTGTATVFTGSQSHGQGHETTFAQIVSDRLGLPIENVEVVHGDTDRIPFGMGTYGSRSLAVGGSAIVKAIDKIVDKGKKIAAHALEAAADDIEFADGTFTVAGTDKSMGIGEVALSAYVPHNYPLDELEPGLDESAFYDPANFTFPNGAHVCEVEIDPETGTIEIASYTAVDDVGRIVNPMIVEGQVHGGIVHGIGQALLEGCVYDSESGQLLTSSYMDYCMPRAADLPSIQTGHTVTPCPHNPLGAKGAGETGTIGSTAAVMNAIFNALAPVGVKDLEMPATPERVWRAISQAGQAAA